MAKHRNVVHFGIQAAGSISVPAVALQLYCGVIATRVFHKTGAFAKSRNSPVAFSHLIPMMVRVPQKNFGQFWCMF